VEAGKMYEIFVSDGSIHSEIGLLLSYNDTILAQRIAVFLVNGKIEKFPTLWYTFREIKDE
tara:strand:+ start:79 stop:261 length:183 start_codon:yes stop_codon:yes gene_type:complete